VVKNSIVHNHDALSMPLFSIMNALEIKSVFFFHQNFVFLQIFQNVLTNVACSRGHDCVE
jgi:hypothetical protein